MQSSDRVTDHAAGSGKRATEIADLIEIDLMERGWPVGEIIGTFADMIETYGVSRAVIREAIGLLEHKMVVEMRHGPGGGIVVRAPVAEAIVGSISSYLDYTGVKGEELFKLRLRLLGLAARLAAERIDDDGIQQLRDVVDRTRLDEREDPQTRVRTLEIFSAITEHSGNPVLTIFWSALVQRVTAGVIGGYDVSPERHQRMYDHQRVVVDAIIARDSRLAERRMHQFLEDIYADVGSQAEQAATQESEMREDVQEAITGVGIPLPAIGRDRRKKLPARVVRQLLREIEEKGLQAGDVLGMERDLLERLSVSRSVFREAVRIIEFYGLAEMRRGPKGGLTVSVPDSAHVEEAIIRYLEFVGANLTDLHEIRVELELSHVEWTIERGDEVISRVAEYIESADDEVRRRGGFRQMFVDLSGNRASRLMSNVLSKMLDRFVFEHELMMKYSPSEKEEIQARLDQNHVDIATAVRARDAESAARFVRRHLEFVGGLLASTGR